MRDGEVADVDGLADALRELYRDNKGLDKRVRVGVANQKIVVRVIDLPVLEDAKELAPRSASRPRTSFRCRWSTPCSTTSRWTSSSRRDGRRQRVLLVAARRDMVERVLAALRGAGLKPEGIDLSAFAMVRALHRAGPEDEHVLYLAVGGLTNLAVARGTACTFARASGGGVEALAVELAERSALTLGHATAGWPTSASRPRSSRSRAIPRSSEHARQVLLDGVRRIAAEVRSSLDFHRMQTTMPRASPAPS